MYKLTDIVEMGHNPLIGGSIIVSIEFDTILPKEEKDRFLEIIDYLDHCLVTDNKEMSKFSARYFLLDKSISLFEDIHTVLFNFIKKDYKCSVSIGKETFTKKLKSYSKLLEYNHKG